MQLNIKVVSLSEIEEVKKGKNNYKTLTVTYENKGKTESKKLVSFASPSVFDAAVRMVAGQTYNVLVEKVGDFWQWQSITEGGVDKVVNDVPKKATNSWETTEERAARQVYIIRQSSVASAVALLKTDKAKLDVNEVIETAKQIEAFVLSKEEAETNNSGFGDMEDDIPF